MSQPQTIPHAPEIEAEQIALLERLSNAVAVSGDVNLAPIVVNEQTVLGSRCGRFADGLSIMREFPDMPLDRLFTARYPLARVREAFVRATQSDALKVLLDISPSDEEKE